MKPTLLLLFALLFLGSCETKTLPEKIDSETEKTIIEKTIKSSIGWVAEKDTSLLYSIIADDENFLEVHPSKKVVKGITDFKKAEKFWLDPRFKAVKCEIWDLQINLSQDGTVAWFYCMLNDINEWDGQPANWENTRWTGVLEKRNNNWSIVQQHFSFACEN